jgi:DNA-binding protein H-NS
MSDLHAHYQQYLELQNQIKALQEKATLLMMEGRNRAIEDIRALIKVYEIRADEVGFAVVPAAASPKRDRSKERKRDRTVKGEPKYRDPETGATWPGTGRTPNWIIGKNFDDYLISRPAAQETPVPVPAREYAPTASPAVDASHAVHGMVSARMPEPAAAWPGDGAPNFAPRP